MVLGVATPPPSAEGPENPREILKECTENNDSSAAGRFARRRDYMRAYKAAIRECAAAHEPAVQRL